MSATRSTPANVAATLTAAGAKPPEHISDPDRREPPRLGPTARATSPRRRAVSPPAVPMRESHPQDTLEIPPRQTFDPSDG